MRSISSVFRAVFSRPGGFTASCILLLCVALTPASMAQTGELVSELQASTQTVSDLTREFANGDSDLEQLKEAFIDERAELTRLKAAITEEREGVQETLNRLGDAVEGEAASVSAQREAVQQQLARLDEAIATADQNLAQVNRLEDEIDQVRRKAFYDDLTERSAMLESCELSDRAMDDANCVNARKAAQKTQTQKDREGSDRLFGDPSFN